MISLETYRAVIGCFYTKLRKKSKLQDKKKNRKKPKSNKKKRKLHNKKKIENEVKNFSKYVNYNMSWLRNQRKTTYVIYNRFDITCFG